MNRVSLCLLFISLSLFLHTANSVDADVRSTLINFLTSLSNSNNKTALFFDLGWNSTSDPCTDTWKLLTCDHHNTSVTSLSLSGLNLNGTLDIVPLCTQNALAKSLTTLELDRNNISGVIQDEIVNCKSLRSFHLSGNRLSGGLPDSLSMLGNLKSFDISNNNFSGKLPDLDRITGLNVFLAQYNQLSGDIPEFDFSNLVHFNLSHNNFSGCIPDVHGLFDASCFSGNPELLGDPLSTKCPGKKSRDQILMYLGYAVLGLVLLVFVIFSICKRKKKEEFIVSKKVEAGEIKYRASSITGELKTEEVSKTEFTGESIEQSMVSSSMVMLASPSVNGLRLDDLLRAPAELLGRGKHGTLYKVGFENGMRLVVKRIKDWAISSDEFKERMQRIDRVRHPNLLPPIAFYCSQHEKLLVYDYQPNGSLYTLLHGSGRAFEWGSRLCTVARVTGALAFAHQELQQHRVAHGNLKSTNILYNKNMDPCISEYGLMPGDDEEETNAKCLFREDIYKVGVVLLEMLTGKVVEKNGRELANWVHSVVSEEWTAEVFDKSLIVEGASEERMVNVLQVALKCVNKVPEARPTIKQVATMINTILEEEERSSTVSET